MFWRYALLLLLSASWVAAAEGKIIKVLPHLLDEKGRHTLSPSLYERDAYQVYLRENPAQISALRFDIQYKVRQPQQPLVMRIEIRGSKLEIGKTEAFETPLRRSGRFSKWAAIRLAREDYDQIGQIVAWRVTLLEGEQEVAAQESFLW